MIVTELFTNRLDSAIHALREGKFILLHDSDSRENEVDMIVAAEHVTPDQIKAMRTDAGGLVCVALGNDVGKEIGITYLYDILLAASEKQVIPRSLLEEFAPYGGRSAFSITVNHRRTFTGITDRDRALTIMELARLAKTAANGGDGCKEAFASDFKAPGHVHLLLESEGSLAARRGHTELSVYLSRLAGMAPAAAICEMLDGKTHDALSFDAAKDYAQAHSIPILDGQQLVAYFLGHDKSSP